MRWISWTRSTSKPSPSAKKRPIRSGGRRFSKRRWATRTRTNETGGNPLVRLGRRQFDFAVCRLEVSPTEQVVGRTPLAVEVVVPVVGPERNARGDGFVASTPEQPAGTPDAADDTGLVVPLVGVDDPVVDRFEATELREPVPPTESAFDRRQNCDRTEEEREPDRPEDGSRPAAGSDKQEPDGKEPDNPSRKIGQHRVGGVATGSRVVACRTGSGRPRLSTGADREVSVVGELRVVVPAVDE